MILNSASSAALYNLPHLILFSLYTADFTSNSIEFFKKLYSTAIIRLYIIGFDHLLHLVRSKISKQCKSRPQIKAEERLAATLRCLASGDSKQLISFYCNMGKPTTNSIIDQVCDALWNSLVDIVNTPGTLNDWENIIEDFDKNWNMSHCLETIDGKRIAMREPENSSSYSHNYKGFFGLVLLAIMWCTVLF